MIDIAVGTLQLAYCLGKGIFMISESIIVTGTSHPGQVASPISDVAITGFEEPVNKIALGDESFSDTVFESFSQLQHRMIGMPSLKAEATIGPEGT